jgi:hypothetical protein
MPMTLPPLRRIRFLFQVFTQRISRGPGWRAPRSAVRGIKTHDNLLNDAPGRVSGGAASTTGR